MPRECLSAQQLAVDKVSVDLDQVLKIIPSFRKSEACEGGSRGSAPSLIINFVEVKTSSKYFRTAIQLEIGNEASSSQFKNLKDNFYAVSNKRHNKMTSISDSPLTRRVESGNSDHIPVGIQVNEH